MADIQIKPIKGSEGRHIVHGPEERDYGRHHYGWIEKRADGFEALGCNERNTDGAVKLGVHPNLRAAGDAVLKHARENLTAEALAGEFEGRTAGGRRIQFLRRAGQGIVATVTERDGRRMTTSWNEDGTCSLHSHSVRGSEDWTKGEDLRLVRREPTLEAEDEPASPKF